MPKETVNQDAIFAQAQERLKGRRVLVTDDGARIREVLRMVLQKAGAEVTEAENGESALAAIRQAHGTGTGFDLLLLDLLMPGKNGVDVLQNVRNNTALRHTPIIVLTAVKDERVAEECERLGVAAYLLKPPTVHDILRAAAEAVEAADARKASEVQPGWDEMEEADEKAPPAPDPMADARSDLGYPLMYVGLPKGKRYALRPAYYRCPFDETTFTAPRLANRALAPVEEEPYHIGLYEKAQEKDFLEFSLVETLVCPGCLYASDRTGFLTVQRGAAIPYNTVSAVPTAEWEPIFLPLTPYAREAMAKNKPDRQKMVRAAGDEGQALFRIDETEKDIPRSHEDALAAMQVALHCLHVLYPLYKEETAVRLRQKAAGFLLKRAHIARLLFKENQHDREEARRWLKTRTQSLQAAFDTLLEIPAVEFRVLQERLICLTRRFFLADELLQSARKEEKKEELARQRKKALADMKTLLIEHRNEKSEEVETVERYLEPIENRMYDLEKAAKA